MLPCSVVSLSSERIWTADGRALMAELCSRAFWVPQHLSTAYRELLAFSLRRDSSEACWMSQRPSWRLMLHKAARLCSAYCGCARTWTHRSRMPRSAGDSAARQGRQTDRCGGRACSRFGASLSSSPRLGPPLRPPPQPLKYLLMVSPTPLRCLDDKLLFCMRRRSDSITRACTCRRPCRYRRSPNVFARRDPTAFCWAHCRGCIMHDGCFRTGR
jgi:hypothetical protein